MKRTITAFSAAFVIATCALASAQTADRPIQQAPTPSSAPTQAARTTGLAGGRLDITAIPAGTLFVRQGKTASQPRFTSYAPGAAMSVKLTDRLHVEGETVFGLASRQDLKFEGERLGEFKPPTMFGYTGNLLVNLVPSHHTIVPYAVGGLGGLHVFSREEIGVTSNNSLVADFGGGAKVMWGSIGIRGDYRLFALRAKNEDEPFIGPDTRFGNRVYAGLVFAPGRIDR